MNPNQNLEDRLVEFAARIINLTGNLPRTPSGDHIARQLLRSGTSPAPNYGEAESAESRKDFVHKLKICLKELRETRIWLKVIVKAKLIDASLLSELQKETDELGAILYCSIETAKRNMKLGPEKM